MKKNLFQAMKQFKSNLFILIFFSLEKSIIAASTPPQSLQTISNEVSPLKYDDLAMSKNFSVYEDDKKTSSQNESLKIENYYLRQQLVELRARLNKEVQSKNEAEDTLQTNQETLRLITEDNKQMHLRQLKWEQEVFNLKQDNEDLLRIKHSLEETNSKLTSELDWKDKNYEEKFKTMRDQLSIHYQTVKKLEGKVTPIF